MLSWFNGFIASYENRENSIDASYYYLAKALAPLPLKGERLDEVKELISNLEKAIDAKVIRKNDQFFISFNQENLEFDSSMVAEGINKISQLIYLIMNGSLTKNTVLFWDEPEVNLNPKYIVVVSQFLQTLASAGVQVFVATHDYLLAHRLSFASEYKELNKNPPEIKFFSLYKNGNGTQIESAVSLAGLQRNTILDEYAALYDLEEH